MEVTHNKKTLILTIDDEEWNDIFDMNDGEYVDVFVDESNIDILFPDWQTYVNENDILNTLQEGDARRFEHLILIHNGHENSYDVIGEDINFANDDEEEIRIIKKGESLDACCLITYYFE